LSLLHLPSIPSLIVWDPEGTIAKDVLEAF